MINELLPGFRPDQVIAIFAVTLGIVGGVLIVVVSVLAGMWQGVRRARIEAGLKQQMIERGMSADEIVRVIGGEFRAAGTDLPCACEAVVEADGEWHSALVLRRAEGRCYVHYIGSDADANEWVTEDRIRVPSPREEGQVGPVAAPRKEPMELEV